MQSIVNQFIAVVTSAEQMALVVAGVVLGMTAFFIFISAIRRMDNNRRDPYWDEPR